jgi:hexulose-6-phosphate isomerase
MKFSYGVMQGRLSKRVGNKIQAFPEKNWRSEFSKAKALGLKSIEWTLDYKNLKKNPILTKQGQSQIKKLSKKNLVKVNSLTGDCFMQNPFWKKKNNQKLLEDLIKIIHSCKIIGIKYIVVPLVDNGSITSQKDEKNLLNSCKYILKYLKDSNLKIVFESDFSPKKLKKFIMKFDKRFFGINYDVGNSAGLNYKIDDEFKLYGNYIYNVHIKDKIKYGKTVRLGSGNATFLKLFKNLKKIRYNRELILQTARSKNDQDIEEIKINLDYLKKFQNV